MNPKFLAKPSLAATLLALAASMGANGQMVPTTPKSEPAASTPAPLHRSANASKPAANGTGLAKGDVKFIEKAAMGGIAEVELGKLAQERAQSPNVKDFAARMVKDHSKANDDLRPIADAKRVALPSGPDKSHQKDIDKLAKKSGADFDKAYMDHMVKDHKKDVKEFQKEAKSGKDPDLKNFASNSLPTLEEHLRLAEETHNAIKGNKKRSG